jgi:hypothetical protein
MSIMKSPLARRLALLLAAVLCLVAVAAPLSHAAKSPVASAAASCSVSKIKYPSTGYITSLKTTKVSCRTGAKVAVSFTKCRLKHGKKGKCTSKVSGYSCKEGQRQSISSEFDARVTCKKGTKKIVFTYQQDL